MRAHFVDTVQAVSPAGSLVLLSGATVTVVTQGTSTPVSATLYAHDDSVDNATKANPFTTGSDGTVDFYLITAARVDLLIAKTGYTAVRRTVDVVAPGASGSSAPVYTNGPTGCDGIVTQLTLPVPASSVVERLILALVPDPGDAGALRLSLGGGTDPTSGNAFPAAELDPGQTWRHRWDSPFPAQTPLVSVFLALGSAGSRVDGVASFATGISDWTLSCVQAADGVTLLPFPAGTVVAVFDT